MLMSTMNNCRLGEFEDVGLAFRKGNILTSHEDRAQGRGSSATHHSPGHCRRLGGFEWRLCGVWSARCGLPQNFHLFGAPCWNVGHGSFCHSFDRMIRCLWLAGLISMIPLGRKKVLCRSHFALLAKMEKQQQGGISIRSCQC